MISSQSTAVSKVAAASMVAAPEESNKKNLEWERFETMMKPFFAQTVPLPELPKKEEFSAKVLFSPTVYNFINPLTLPLFIMSLIENAARLNNAEYREVNQLIDQSLSFTLFLLPPWWHCQQFMQNPPIYLKQAKNTGMPLEKILESYLLQTPANHSIEHLILKGQDLLKRLAQRALWLVDQMPKQFLSVTQDTYKLALLSIIKIVAADRIWKEDVTKFTNECHFKINELHTKNPNKFKAFQEMQTKGIHWPHSQELLKTIEAAHFEWNPTMLLRDSCSCKTCGAKVNGWRSWHNPWSFHDYKKHPPTFLKPLQLLSQNVINYSPERLKNRKELLKSSLASLGTVLRVLDLNTPNVPWTAQSYLIMENKNRNTIIISSLQLNDFIPPGKKTPVGIEIIMECPESLIVCRDDSKNWMYQLVKGLSNQAARPDSAFYLLEQLKILSYSIPDINVPEKYKDENGNVTVLVGIKSPHLPEFLLEGSVRLVTARLLTNAEWLEIKDKGPNCRQLLVERFTKDQTYHLSSIVDEANVKTTTEANAKSSLS